LSQHRTSRTSINSQRPVSPGLTHRRPASPQASPRQSMASIRSTAPSTKPAQSRNASAATVKKSPVAQMRQDFDTLKVKVSMHWYNLKTKLSRDSFNHACFLCL
jgi:hypothetical protein